MYSSTYNSPRDNYGSGIGMKPFGGAISRSLTTARMAPAGMGGTGNATQDAMRRAQFDLSRNLMQSSRQQAENAYRTEANRARIGDVFGLRSDAGRQYELGARRQVDDAGRAMQLQQSKARIAQNLRSARTQDRWNAIADYVGMASSPAVLHPQFGVFSHLVSPQQAPSLNR